MQCRQTKKRLSKPFQASLDMPSGSANAHKFLCRQTASEEETDSYHARLPTWVWVAGLLTSGIFCTAVLTPMLHMKVYEPIAAVALALLVAVLAVRALGQTDLVRSPSSICGSNHRIYVSLALKPGDFPFTSSKTLLQRGPRVILLNIGIFDQIDEQLVALLSRQIQTYMNKTL